MTCIHHAAFFCTCIWLTARCVVRFWDPALIGSNAGCSVEGGASTLEGQCPLQFRPLFKGIAKNYPTSGMLGSRYAAEEFNRLLSGQDRIIGVARREALAAGFPALFEVVRSCEWQRIPSEFLPLLKALRAKARIPLRCTEVSARNCQLCTVQHMPLANLSNNAERQSLLLRCLVAYH